MSPSTAPPHKKKAAIVGNPNVGKSNLFNQLTRAYSLVANFPYTTMSVTRADVVIAGERFEIIDTPGILSLDMLSEDGMVTREILLREQPELIILCLDANNLQRSLMLAAQILELGVPVIACLNMIDESQQKGLHINRDKLEQLLGVPVMETIASEGQGIKQLLKKVPQAVTPPGKIMYTAGVENAVRAIVRCFPAEVPLPRAVALLLLQQDQAIGRYLRETFGDARAAQAGAIAENARHRFREPLERHIREKRTRWSEKIAREVTRARHRAPDRRDNRLACAAPGVGMVYYGCDYLRHLSYRGQRGCGNDRTAD